MLGLGWRRVPEPPPPSMRSLVLQKEGDEDGSVKYKENQN
jgi:hypothetical protein